MAAATTASTDSFSFLTAFLRDLRGFRCFLELEGGVPPRLLLRLLLRLLDLLRLPVPGLEDEGLASPSCSGLSGRPLREGVPSVPPGWRLPVDRWVSERASSLPSVTGVATEQSRLLLLLLEELPSLMSRIVEGVLLVRGGDRFFCFFFTVGRGWEDAFAFGFASVGFVRRDGLVGFGFGMSGRLLVVEGSR